MLRTRFRLLVQTEKTEKSGKKTLPFATLHSGGADAALFARLERNSSLEIYERHPHK